METFSALLALCAGNSPVPGEFLAQRPVTRSFDVYFDLRLNKRLCKQSWGWWFETLLCPLWRHSNAYMLCNRWLVFMSSSSSLHWWWNFCLYSSLSTLYTMIKDIFLSGLANGFFAACQIWSNHDYVSLPGQSSHRGFCSLTRRHIECWKGQHWTCRYPNT